MKILAAHNYYQIAGGEDHVYQSECALLERFGHQVVRYEVHNDAMSSMGKLHQAKVTLWNEKTLTELGDIIAREKPDLAHFHNTFPLISPAGYEAAKRAGVPVVQTLHNYRLACPNGLFYRDGHVCEECLTKTFKWPGVLHGCYRGSKAASMVVAAMLAKHRAQGTYREKVDSYFILSEFARTKFIAAGLPAEKLAVKPNFVEKDYGMGAGQGGFALWVGRLSQEKGTAVMLDAWRHLKPELKLRIIGDGPDQELVKATAASDPRIEWLGKQPKDEVMANMRDATCLIFPSVCYEGMPMAVLEAFSAGLPSIASAHGAMATLIEEGRTGLLFPPGDAMALAKKVEEFLSLGGQLAPMRQACRAEFESHFTAESNYELMIKLYSAIIAK